MISISITDVTIKQSGKNAGYTLSFCEKIEIAKLLDKLGVNVIELHGIENEKVDSLLIKSIGSAVKDSTVAVSVALDDSSVKKTWNALREAKHPRLQVPAPMSAVQMEYLAGMKPQALLTAIGETVRACCTVCNEVEFIADDATRAEFSFLCDAIHTAIAAGANIITICDTAGTMLPATFSSLIERIQAAVPELATIRFGVSCCNALSMADACAISALRRGASEVKTAANCVDTVSLENISKILAAKASEFDATFSIQTTQLKRLLSQIVWLCESSRSKTSPFENGVQDASDLYLTAHDDRAAVMKVVAMLGYDLNEEDAANVYQAFQRIAEHKETVGTRELDAIIASSAMQVPAAYHLESFVITSGNTISATANMKLSRDGKLLESVCLGDGPIDAAILAIEQIAGQHYELDDFQIQAVTEGREAMGETIVKLRSNGKLYSGRGISTDIIGASIHAYLNALNKIVYEESGN